MACDRVFLSGREVNDTNSHDERVSLHDSVVCARPGIGRLVDLPVAP